MLLKVKVSPRSSKNEVIEMPDKSLKVKLTAAPVEGEANEALIKLLAKHFNIAKSRINIISGQKGRNKKVEID